MTEKTYPWSGYEIIDTYTHVFPSKVSAKAAYNIGRFYDLPSRHDGSCEALLANGRELGVSRFVICSVATTPHQVRDINDFIAAQQREHPEFIGFGALHPMLDGIGAEADRICALGLRGLKLHPDFQRFDIDCPEAYEIYDAIRGRLPLLVHVGDDRYEYSRPAKLARVVKDFPDLEIIAAHLGGFRKWDEAWEYLKGLHIKYDVSSTMPVASIGRTRKQLYYLGVENCFFGTDYPLWNYREALERFMSLELPEEDLRRVFSENFKEFLHLR